MAHKRSTNPSRTARCALVYLVAWGLLSCTQPQDTGTSPQDVAPNTDEAPTTGQNSNQTLEQQPKPVANPNNAAGQGNQPVPSPVPTPKGPAVRYIGRTDALSDPRGTLLSWPGSQIVIGFAGTALNANLTEMDASRYAGVSVNNYVKISVDGAAPTRIKLSRTAPSYVVASGLPQGQHQAVLTKITEGQFGRIRFDGSSTDGALTDTTVASARRLEFIGDSGTAGYGASGNAPCSFTVDTEDAALAYPALVGNLLAAEAHNLSYSGKGLVQNRDMVNDNYKTLPVLWGRTLPQDANELPYNPNGWLPQAVVMTIGGNDFKAQVLDQNTFNATVMAFIKEVQAKYTGVHVYLGVSPMLRDDAHPDQRAAGLRYAQAAVATLADSRVHYLDLPADLGANGYGCDQHMSPATHRLVANVIAQTLKTQFSW